MRIQHTITDKDKAAWEKITGENLPVGTTLTITAPKSLVGRDCACGCGGKTGGGLWVPGHDAKRKSLLFAEFRSGDPERKAAAEKELIARDWPIPNAKQDRKPVTPSAPVGANVPETPAS